MGEYYMRAGKIKDAIGEFKSAVRLNPDYIRGYLKLAEAYAADSDMNESRKANENAFRLNGGKITPLNFI
jgi:cytochrome c-type biogenesis protein CcmH/NrfG